MDIMEEINAQNIKEKAKEKQIENKDFVRFIKNLKGKNLDEKVFELADKYIAETDCTLCGNCCKNLHPALEENDIEKLSIFLKENSQDFKEKFLISESNKPCFYIKNSPCNFLEGNICTVYENRPASCADYPHLHQPHFRFRIDSIMENYAICPIVFKTIEELKTTVYLKP